MRATAKSQAMTGAYLVILGVLTAAAATYFAVELADAAAWVALAAAARAQVRPQQGLETEQKKP